MSEPIIAYRGTVYPWQCDHMGHMNTMWYAGRFDEASWQLLCLLGLTPTRLRDGHCGMAAVEQRTCYFRELHPGDPITVRSMVVEVGDKSITLRHEMTADENGILAATSVVVGVHFDTGFRKARSLPTDVRERALKMMGANSPMNVADPSLQAS